MCRMAGWASRTMLTAAEALGPEAIDRFAYLSTVHEDGWGAAWIDATGTQQSRHSVLPAHLDPQFRAFATQTRSTACVLHARLGTRGYGEGAANVHPFSSQGWAFVHNGAILPKQRIARLMPVSSFERIGDTDSEVYLFALLDAMRDSQSIAQAVSVVVSRVAGQGMRSSSLNAMLLGPNQLAVISEYDPAAGTSGVRVWPDDKSTPAVDWPEYHPMVLTAREHLVAFASSGIIPDLTEWTSMPNHTVATVGLDEFTVHQLPIEPVPSTFSASHH